MNKLYIAAICAAALTFTGCVGSFNEDDYVMTTPALMESVTVSGDLADSLKITQTSKMKTESGVEVVCIRGRLKREGFASFVMNRKNSVELTYKFTWFDAQGKEVANAADKWHSLTLKPGSEFACTSTAPAKEINKVSLIIRKAGEEAPAVAASAPAKQDKTAKAPAKAAPKTKKNTKNDCLCGCAQGEKCYCPEGAPCPNAGKNKKK
ncbi:MAG: YcfL family protein [Lentisphaeria bacterium]|nr:YcfL family protein [Lentisphaeria bacterium]